MEKTLKMADTLMANRQYGQACDVLGPLADAQPRLAPARFLLSKALLLAGRFAESEKEALACFALGNDKPDLLFGLARQLGNFLRRDEVRACLSRPRFRREAPPAALAEAAVLLNGLGDSETAMQLLELALARDPRHAPSLYFRGNLKLFAGAFDAANDDYERCLSHSPGYAQAAWMQSSIRTWTTEQNHVSRLRQQLRNAQPGLGAEIYLSFALFKELNDLERFDEAWAALDYGCRAKRAKLSYDKAQTARLFDVLKQSRLRLDQQSQVDASVTPIFIVGMHRSGTTLLERILGGHSAVTDGGESYGFSVSMRRHANQSGNGVVDITLAEKLAGASAQGLAEDYRAHNHSRSNGRPFLTEKLPSNFLNLGFIAEALPEARFLHLVRDQMETCFGNLRVLFSEAAAYSYQQDELADYFIRYRDLMSHWHARYPGRILDVDFQALTTDTERVAREVMVFCGLPFEADALDISRRRSSVATASAAQVRQRIEAPSAPAWLPYADKLQTLKQSLARADLA